MELSNVFEINKSAASWPLPDFASDERYNHLRFCNCVCELGIASSISIPLAISSGARSLTDSGKFDQAYLNLACAKPLSSAEVLDFQSFISPFIKRVKSSNSSASALFILANCLIEPSASLSLAIANITEIIDALPVNFSKSLLTSKVRLAEICDRTFCIAIC